MLDRADRAPARPGRRRGHGRRGKTSGDSDGGSDAQPAARLVQEQFPGKPQTTGTIEVYEGKKVVSDGEQSLELYAVTGSPHVEPMVLAYAPKGRALFQSDLFFPGTGGGGPAAEHLLASIRMLNLKVDTNVGGHGGVGPFAELVKATTPAWPAAK